jgi:hypothetical protein
MRTKIAISLALGLAAACSSASNPGSPPGGGGDGGPADAGEGGTSSRGDGGAGPHASCAADKFALAPPVAYPLGKGPYVVAKGDMNGDGKIDLVIGNPSDAIPPDDNPSIGVLLGKGDGTFGKMAAFPYPPHAPVPQTVSVGDLDGDGKLDVLGFGQDVNSDPYYLPGNGDGTLGAPVDIPVNARVSGGFLTATADFNGDGKIDILVSTYAGDLGVLLNSGGAKFGGDVDYDTGGELAGIAIADFDGDQKPDIATADVSGPSMHTVVVLMNKGTGAFAAPVTYAASTGSDNSGDRIAAADFNGDGKADIAVSQGIRGSLDVLMNKGDGTFGAATTYAAGSPAGGMIAVDFRGNGLFGFAVVNNKDNGVIAAPGTLSVLLPVCP